MNPSNGAKQKATITNDRPSRSRRLRVTLACLMLMCRPTWNQIIRKSCVASLQYVQVTRTVRGFFIGIFTMPIKETGMWWGGSQV